MKPLGFRWSGVKLGGAAVTALGLGLVLLSQGLAHAAEREGHVQTPPQLQAQAMLQTQTPVEPPPQFLPITATATIGKHKFNLEVAETPAQKSLGMQGRPQLPTKRGMLFVFDPPQPVAFWMKGTKHPLDLLFINEGRLQRVVRSAKPCLTEQCPFYGTVDRPMEYVLELRGGTAKSLDLRPGDQVRIDFKDGRSKVTS